MDQYTMDREIDDLTERISRLKDDVEALEIRRSRILLARELKEALDEIHRIAKQ